MDIHNHFDFTAQGRRPTVAQIIAAWKKAGRPARFSVQYGETEAEFQYIERAKRWDDSGNGCRGVDRLAVVKALQAQPEATSATLINAFGLETEADIERRAPVEPGAASIKLELSGGHIAVYHGTDGTLLAELRDAPLGTWDRMWTALEGLGVKRRFK